MIEVTASRESEVGGLRVRRALPRRDRRTVGAWCFADHLGPASVTPNRGMDVAPHPHIGLQTVTWLFAGQVLHRDSLGNEQLIRPGQLNLMTAGHGVSHSEEHVGGYRGELHGIQLWVAQPDASRHGPAAFEHHGELPQDELPGAVMTVLVGDVDGTASPARHDTAHVGVDLELHGAASIPLRADFEHALVVCAGSAEVDGARIEPGHLAFLGAGRDEVGVASHERSRALLLGGLPFEEPIVMWWNYVGRTRAEVIAAHDAWLAADERFGTVASALPRIEVPGPPWRR